MTHALPTVSRRPHRRAWIALCVFAFLVLLTYGMVPADEGQLSAAIAAQRARVAVDANATDLNDLANLLVVRGDLEQAEESYRQAWDLAPESIEIPYNLALLLQHLEKNSEALKLFRNVVKKAPDAAWAHLQIGIISSDKGKRRQAIDAFTKAFSLEPRLASPKINPHLQRRPEVLRAMLNTSSDAMAPQTAPLSFSEPDRIARLLVGESAAARAAKRSIERRGLIDTEAVAVETAETGTQPMRRLDVESLPESAQSEAAERPRAPLPPETEADIVDDEKQDPEPSMKVGREDVKAQDTGQEETRRVVGNDDLRAVRGAGVTGPSSSSSNSSSARPGGRSRPSNPASASPRSRTPVSGGRTSRFRPGARSSARLELELRTMPTPDRPVASRWSVLPGTAR